MRSDTRQELRDLGVPVRAVFHCIPHPGRDRSGGPSLLISMGQHAGGFLVLDVDVNGGRCVQHECRCPGAFEASASFRSATTGALYAGSCYTGQLHRFVPGAAAIEDMGAVDPALATFPCGIDEAPDGAIFVGAYPGCCLSRFNPATGEWTRFGRMDETDMYFYPRCGADGTVAGLVRMCRPHVVALDPRTGERRSVGPVVDTQEQSGRTVELFKGRDGLLYIRSSEGGFRVSGLEAVPVAELPEPMPPATLPDGSTVEFTDAATFDYRRIRVRPPAGAPHEIPLTWEGAGTDIFLLHEGPDGRVYGSSILPERLFSCRPDGAGMTDHGPCSVSGGEAYSMANLGGRMYIASYPAARLSIYDPRKPYRFGTEAGANPRDVGRPDDVAYRPRAMLAGPAGKVWIGSIPDYGMWGGTLASYDPATGVFASHRDLIPECSVTALAWLPGAERILVGTAVEGGTGTQPRARAAGFVVWDPVRDRADGVETFGLEGIHGVMDVMAAGPRHAYAVVVFPGGEGGYTAELLLLDLAARRAIDRSRFGGEYGWPLEVALRIGPDGCAYGATRTQIYRIEPGSARREVLWKTAVGQDAEYVSVSGPIIGRTYFLARRHRLLALDIG